MIKRVLLRLDLNVPLKDGRIVDDFRIVSSLPTIRALLRQRAQVFIITHLEQDGIVPHLDRVHKRLATLLHMPVHFLRGTISQKPKSVSERVVLFDNIRLNLGEERNDKQFAKRLAAWGDEYINDAFGVCHRMHASVVGVPRLLPSKLGPLVKKEMKELSRAFRPKRPFLVILGGKKFSTKEPLLKVLLHNADTVFVGGALANTFLHQRGISIGTSVFERLRIPNSILWHKKILLPSDVVVLRSGRKRVVSAAAIQPRDVVVDAGRAAVRALDVLVGRARFVLWNGTLGLCEKGFCGGTRALARSIGRPRAYSIVGGGDTVAALHQMKCEKNFDFVSTGGGAMLEFLARGTLPGLEAVQKRN